MVDFVRADGEMEDLHYLLDLLENDPDPGLQHKLAGMLIENPPFRRGHKDKFDLPDLVERIWTNINCMFSHDTRLRCDMVDLYYTLYGGRRPYCLPLPELEGILCLDRHRADAASMNKSRPSTSVFHRYKSPIPNVNTIKPKVESPQKDLSSGMVIEEQVDMMNEDVIMTEEKIIKEEPLDLHVEPSEMMLPKQEYYSDNSVSLPGMGLSGPVGFESEFLHCVQSNLENVPGLFDLNNICPD
ncbi:hypothetical protein HHI36_006897 [Cryptolaemus montrouzieri]|uniref:Transcription initiation factor TFIID subunit 2 TPR repeats domain-containing protein n=1 Tax=Cryptolaemus montrouzieri TaxID=559131 RepID=A0ABD2MNF0_9CUCU